MKQFKPTVKTIGDNKFYIRPFPAFTAAKITGDLANVATPLLAAIAPLILKYMPKNGSGGEVVKKALDADISEVAPALSGAFSGLSGDKLEHLCRELLTAHGNISVSPGGDDSMNKLMEESDANDLFAGELDEMFALMFEVIKINFSGFFKKLAAQYGLASDSAAGSPSTANTAPLT